ncbi:hypothetical protein [Pseudomonas sp. HS6]|uniref:hypothetical protein n=1 Tax=Pseudomonas sp. HS6 TaxID=2850559 RepID=UPI00201874C2|nr:hypothetical protein [Pseudomonas sp. HS6]UQS17781.1 hypothetical protein JJN09_13240 [Pseudomonas sp. HS6]
MTTPKKLNAAFVSGEFKITAVTTAENHKLIPEIFVTKILDGITSPTLDIQLNIIIQSSGTLKKITMEIPFGANPKLIGYLESIIGVRGVDAVSYNISQEEITCTITKLTDNLFEYDIHTLKLASSSSLVRRTSQISGSGKLLIQHI